MGGHFFKLNDLTGFFLKNILPVPLLVLSLSAVPVGLATLCREHAVQFQWNWIHCAMSMQYVLTSIFVCVGDKQILFGIK